MIQLPGQGRSNASRRALRPLMRVSRTPAASGSTARRNTAAEASRAARRGRNNTPSVWPRSAASCRRRISRSFGRRIQPRTASQAPEPSACSKAHRGRAPPTTAIRSSITPQAASAGANGISGGATHTHQRALAARVSAASAGMSSVSSPLPKRETRISIRPVRGQPLSGRYSSSAAYPLDNPARRAALRPRQMAGCSSSRAIFAAPTTMPAHQRTWVGTSSHQAARSAAPHHAHDDSFDEQGLLFQIHLYRLELAVLGQQPYDRAFLAIALHGDFVLEPRDLVLGAGHHRGAMHRHEIPIEYSGILHAHADDFQQVMRPGLEYSRVDLQPRFEILLGEDGLTGGYPADEWQSHLFPDGVL